MGAGHQRERDTASSLPRGALRQALPEQIGDGVLQLAVLLDGADLDLAYEIVGKVERGLDAPILPESWFYGDSSRHSGRPTDAALCGGVSVPSTCAGRPPTERGCSTNC
jgi:hypothetical protein